MFFDVENDDDDDSSRGNLYCLFFPQEEGVNNNPLEDWKRASKANNSDIPGVYLIIISGCVNQ